MPDAEVLAASHGRIAQLRVIGRATFKISQNTKEFCLRSIGGGAGQLIIDFSECLAMDSTFMGVLAMVGLECAEKKCDIVFVNADAHLRGLLENLGIDGLFRFSQQKVAEVSFTSLCSAAGQAADMSQVADTVLEAHKTLMQVAPANVPRFKNVVDMLSADIEHLKKTEGDSR